jgi:hypothetical protein
MNGSGPADNQHRHEGADPTPLVELFLPGPPLDGGEPTAFWGPMPPERVRWMAANPYDLAENGRGVHVELRVGDGTPGALGPCPAGDRTSAVEVRLHATQLRLHERLASLGIDHVWGGGAGQHCMTYAEAQLERFLPAIMRLFDDPPPPPVPFDFLAAEPDYRVYGWEVHVDRPAMEFSRLVGARPDGFALTGSGTASVTTAPWYRPGEPYHFECSGPHEPSPSRVETCVADREGRLRLRLTLGPGNRIQEHAPGDTCHVVYRVEVAITGPGLGGRA